MLIILGGLPGTGKTTIARELARRLAAVHVRIDSIEQALLGSGKVQGALEDAGYRIGYAVAEDNLAVGRVVIADSVNPLPITRAAWVAVAERAGVGATEIEIRCSDVVEHRRRVETRTIDVPGLRRVTWPEVVSRDYRPWAGEPMIVDTAGQTIEQTMASLRGRLGLRD